MEIGKIIIKGETTVLLIREGEEVVAKACIFFFENNRSGKNLILANNFFVKEQRKDLDNVMMHELSETCRRLNCCKIMVIPVSPSVETSLLGLDFKDLGGIFLKDLD